MRTKFLLSFFLLMIGAFLYAQGDTIRTLVISEARIDDQRRAYVEISNVGDDPINLAEFELGVIGPWTAVTEELTPNWVWGRDDRYYMMLPDVVLQPGESFTLANIYDWGPEMYLISPEDYDPFLTKKEWWTLADIQLHVSESPTGAVTDSVHPKYRILENWSGRDCLYLMHRFAVNDSAIVDQVNGIFDATDDTRSDKDAINVAGYTDATAATTLIRKFTVKRGNIDFASGRGEDITESEWLPIPHQAGGAWADNVRRLFWTAGNHGDYNLNETTLTSDVIDIDWNEDILTVPWGIRRDDSVMFKFDYQPGFAWHYDYNDSYEDSASFAAKTGDTLTIYAAGNDLDIRRFRIEVGDPAEDIAIVIPKRAPGDDGFYEGQNDPVYSVSDGLDMDTIGTARFGGIPYATRVDTLFKYLEKADGAEWAIVWKDGAERTDLTNGDILEVTAPDGTTKKQYFIKTDKYRPSHNAYLSSITWPDIPDTYRDFYGWIGDTVPNFVATKYNYRVQVPADVDGIPVLVTKKQNDNSKVAVTKARNLNGAVPDRTVTFVTTAEDDTSKRTYTVQFDKEILPAADTNRQALKLDPFISQFVWQDQWANGFIEVVNPSTDVLDLSNYMFAWGYVNTPAEAITRLAAPEDWINRFGKYIPGYKWIDETNWQVTPAIAVEDAATYAMVAPGDVFVIGDIYATGESGYPWWASEQCDVFLDATRNPWNEATNNWNMLQQWNGANWYLFRIENDSIKDGLKPATDPADFTLIDVFGSGDGSNPVVGGVAMEQTTSYIRKPEFYTGNPVFKGSFGTDINSTEWNRTDRPYYQARGVPWPNDILFITEDLGSHYMYEPTLHRSVITSMYYIVSPGVKDKESIAPVDTNTTVEVLLSRISKVDPGQTLVFKSAADGSILQASDTLLNGDSLIVTSANLENVTKYIITVTTDVLSDDAVLTSEDYEINIDDNIGTISPLEYGTNLSEVFANVTVPAGATLTIIDDKGAYVPFKTLRFDTAYVDTKISDKIFFEVVSESKLDTIVYQLRPTAESSDAFVISDVFDIDQELFLIDLLPSGLNDFPAITAPSFLANLIPATGATMQLVDKLGFERAVGFVVKDDKLIVTSEDETNEVVYYLKMLGDEEFALAYVTSEVYLIDQFLFSISGEAITNETSVAAFIANLVPAEGATITVTDATGAPKSSGNLQTGDLLSVIASDGLTENIYIINVLTSTADALKNNIDVYPNPSNGRFYLTGLKSGYKIQVTNLLGALVLERQAVAEKDEISIEREKSGIYFISVVDKNNVVGRFKVVKK